MCIVRKSNQVVIRLIKSQLAGYRYRNLYRSDLEDELQQRVSFAKARASKKLQGCFLDDENDNYIKANGIETRERSKSRE